MESLYVTLSRAKEHVQVYTDNQARWQQLVQQSDAGKTAHDLLHQESDLDAATGNRLLATASRLDKTALGRRVLAENGLEGETMARFIAAGKKYPTPYVALPAWTRHGQEAGALLTEIRIEDDGMRVVLSDESRLRGSEDAQFAGLQASRNGQTLIADSAEAALQLAQENPESGVVIRLHGEERLLNAVRLTGGVSRSLTGWPGRCAAWRTPKRRRKRKTPSRYLRMSSRNWQRHRKKRPGAGGKGPAGTAAGGAG